MYLRQFFMLLFFGLSLFFIGSFFKMAYQSLHLSKHGIMTRGKVIDIIQSKETLTYYKAIIQFYDQVGKKHLSPPLPLQKSFMTMHHYDFNQLAGYELSILYDESNPSNVELINYRNYIYPLENLFFFLLTIVPAFYFRYKINPSYRQRHKIRFKRRREREISYHLYFDPTNPLHVGKYNVPELNNAISNNEDTAQSNNQKPPQIDDQ